MQFARVFRLLLALLLAGGATWLLAVRAQQRPVSRGARVTATTADLRLDWLEGGVARREVAAERLGAGAERRFPVRVTNTGGTGARVRVRFLTPLGPLSSPVSVHRLAASASVDLEVPLVAAVGMRELCVVAELPVDAVDAPLDPNPADNRLCRRLVVFDSQDP